MLISVQVYLVVEVHNFYQSTSNNEAEYGFFNGFEARIRTFQVKALVSISSTF